MTSSTASLPSGSIGRPGPASLRGVARWWRAIVAPVSRRGAASDAAGVRRLAWSAYRDDPRIAAELLAAADRHDRLRE